jgi:diguanylate cyclase (GGDEF)-like protein
VVLSNKTTGRIAGAVLGLGAPAGSLLLRMMASESASIPWIARELSGHAYFYAYMTLLTPLAFSFFGVYLGGLNDKISAQKRSLEALTNVLEAQSMTDDVTGLYNHRHLLEEIEKEVERSQRYKRFLSGIMVDIDDFKEVNDTHGHVIGDLVLREMALVLNQSIRKIDIVGRYGGDEFVVILPEAEWSSAHAVAERILQNIRQHRFKTKGDYISLTVSVGLFYFKDTTGLDKTQFIERIDEAMFQAKALGKDKVFSVADRVHSNLSR